MFLSKFNIIEIPLDEMPFYHRRGAKNGNTYVKFGNAKSNNNPYAYVEEKRVSNKICRVLCPNKVIDSALVISEDGTVWKVWFSNFEKIEKINIIK